MMNEVENRKYEMLARVREFGATHAPAFASGSFAAGLLAEIAAAVEKLSSHSVAQATGGGTAREGTANRRLAREALRDDLEMMSRTARTISVRIPNIAEKFRIPTTTRDQALLDAARAFATDAKPLEAEFALHELSAEFFAKLDVDIAAFERALAVQTRGREARIAATAAIDSMVADGVRAVRQLDTIVRNKFAADPATLTAWTSVSRIRHTGGTARPHQPEPVAVGDGKEGSMG